MPIIKVIENDYAEEPMKAKYVVQVKERERENIMLAMRLFEDEKDLNRRFDKAARWVRWYREQGDIEI